MICIIQLEKFYSKADTVLTDDEFITLSVELQENPLKGDIIEGTSGARKVRIAYKDREKRGGARVIYYYLRNETIYLLDFYTKAEKADLLNKDKKRIKELIEDIR